MSENAPSVLDDVLAERERQNEQWGEQNHADGWWTAILTEEVGEAAQAALKAWGATSQSMYDDWEDNLRCELVQVAAVAVQWVEAIDRRRERR